MSGARTALVWVVDELRRDIDGTESVVNSESFLSAVEAEMYAFSMNTLYASFWRGWRAREVPEEEVVSS